MYYKKIYIRARETTFLVMNKDIISQLCVANLACDLYKITQNKETYLRNCLSNPTKNQFEGFPESNISSIKTFTLFCKGLYRSCSCIFSINIQENNTNKVYEDMIRCLLKKK